MHIYVYAFNICIYIYVHILYIHIYKEYIHIYKEREWVVKILGKELEEVTLTSFETTYFQSWLLCPHNEPAWVAAWNGTGRADRESTEPWPGQGGPEACRSALLQCEGFPGLRLYL